MGRGKSVPITPEVLDWAIHESGHDVGAIAEAVGVDLEDVEAWLSGADEKPTVTQFHKLAGFLKRPEAVFFLPRAPETRPVEVQFRSPPGTKRREPSPDERLSIREAARLQRGLAWVLEALGAKSADMPAYSVSDDLEQAAVAVRRQLGITVAAQLQWGSEYEAAHRWREALERSGVYVLFLSMGKESVQGFSLWHDVVPVIAVNTTHWKAQARIYTMFHECAHLLTRTSSICAKGTSRPWTDGDQVERWCEEFAAALLLPWRAVEQRLTQRFGWKPGSKITDLGYASYIANQFKVSLRAAVLRLVNKDVAGWNLYRAIPPLSDTKAKGGPPAEEGQGRRPQRRLQQYGVRTVRTFLRGVRSDAITRDDALRYLDVADTDIDELETLTAAE